MITYEVVVSFVGLPLLLSLTKYIWSLAADEADVHSATHVIMT
jgi:hypothetical protein